MDNEIITLKHLSIVTRKIFAFTRPERMSFVIRVYCEGDSPQMAGLVVSYETLEEALSDYDRLKGAININLAERDLAIGIRQT